MQIIKEPVLQATPQFIWRTQVPNEQETGDSYEGVVDAGDEFGLARLRF